MSKPEQVSIGQLTTFLIDLDGVIYRGEELLPGADKFIAWLEANQKKYLFLTNNSFASETQVIAKLKRLGITVDKTHVLGAGQAAVQNIARRFPAASVYVVGEPPLFDLVREHQLTIANPDGHTANVVLVGLDRTFDYQKLKGAVIAVRSGATFVAINRDPLLPVVGDLIPGCGAMVAAIEASSEVQPEVIGKPQPMLLLEALHSLGSQPEEAIMIGDTLGVDIRAGIAAGTHTLLVLSGSTTRASLEKSTLKPDYVYENIGAALKEILKH